MKIHFALINFILIFSAQSQAGNEFKSYSGIVDQKYICDSRNSYNCQSVSPENIISRCSLSVQLSKNTAQVKSRRRSNNSPAKWSFNGTYAQRGTLTIPGLHSLINSRYIQPNGSLQLPKGNKLGFLRGYESQSTLRVSKNIFVNLTYRLNKKNQETDVIAAELVVDHQNGRAIYVCEF